MITAFGQWSRKLRIEKNELLADMANKLNVTASFLSAVENGKKRVPIEWGSKLSRKYGLDELAQEELNDVIMHSVTQIRVNTKGMSGKDQRLVYAFARRFSNLDAEAKKKIGDILDDD